MDNTTTVPAVNRELVISSDVSEVNIVLLEDKQLVELHKEQINSNFSVGDVYYGRVKKILPGLNAAFVDIGNQKDAFLHYLDLGPQINSLLQFSKLAQEGKTAQTVMSKFKLCPDIDKTGKISDFIQAGDQIPVQIAKEPINTKGPRISAEISFAGRYIVLVPFSNRVSVSQKIRSGEERGRLKKLIQSIRPNNFGVIIRTVAEGKKVEDLDADMKYLLDKWEQVTESLYLPTDAITSRSSAGKNSLIVFFSRSCARCGSRSEIMKTGSPGLSPSATSTFLPSFFTIVP